MLSAQPSAIYGLKHQSRSVAANTGLAEQHQFIVGTASHREENELHYVVFNEETNAIEPRGVFSHPPEMYARLAPSPCTSVSPLTLAVAPKLPGECLPQQGRSRADDVLGEEPQVQRHLVASGGRRREDGERLSPSRSRPLPAQIARAQVGGTCEAPRHWPR